MDRCIDVARYDAEATRHYAAMSAQRERAYFAFFFRATEAELVQGGGELAPSAQREPDLGGLVGEPLELLALGNLTVPIRNQSIETPD